MMPGQSDHSEMVQRGRARSRATALREVRAIGWDVEGPGSLDVNDDDEHVQVMGEFLAGAEYQELLISAFRSRNMITREIECRSDSSGSGSGMSTEDSVVSPQSPPRQDKSESFTPGFKPVIVELSGDPISSPVSIKARKDEKPWIRGNTYNWPVGTLFDHIGKSSKEWDDDGGSSSEEEDGMQTGDVKVDKGEKIPVTHYSDYEMKIRNWKKFA